MFVRTSNSGHEVVWDPEHTDLAAQAIAQADGTDFDTAEAVQEAAPVDVSDDAVANRIKERYWDFVVENA